MTRRQQFASWLAETHGGLFELVRHFLGESLSSELISSPEHLQRLAIGVLAALGTVGAVIPRMYFQKYLYLQNLPNGDLYLMAVRADRLFFISASMLIAGMTTVLLWTSLFPSRRDFLVLGPLPVRMAHVFLARLVSVLLLVAGVIFAANLNVSFAFPMVTDGRWQTPSVGPQYFFAHAVATIGAAFFVFFALVAIQGTLMNLLPVRHFERLSLAAQILLLLVILAAIPPAFSLPNLHREIAAHPLWLDYLPSAWFLGLYERLLGNADPYFAALARRAVWLLGGTTALAALSYLASYRRYAARSLVLSAGRQASLFSRAAGHVSRLVFPAAEQQAVAGFVAATFQRSRQHKLLLAVYLGVALAFAVDSAGAFLVIHRGTPLRYERLLMMQSILAVPFVITLLLVFGLAHVFRIPTEPRANWIFRMGDQRRAEQFLLPTGKLITMAGLLPVLAITPFATWFALGWRVAWMHTAFAAALALVICEFALAEWDRIPFTCSYLAGRRPFFNIAAIAVSVFVFLTTVVSGIESVLLRSAFRVAVAVAVLLALYAWKVYKRHVFWREARLMFDDTPDAMFTTLAILPE